MSTKSSSIQLTVTIGITAVLLAGIAGPAEAASKLVDCSKNGKLQQEIDAREDGDTIEIKGICMENIVIRDKALTLVGHSSPGPHGITGVNANTDGVRVEHSRGTHLAGLVISNPFFAGVRIRYNSDVTMTDCTITQSFGGSGTGIWVQESSIFSGTGLTLNENLRGLGAASGSRAFCFECDFNDNVNWGATATGHSTVSLLDSEVNGDRGINSSEYSYIDLDCLSHDSTHACKIDAAIVAGQANLGSTVAFYDAGEFNGSFRAFTGSNVQLLGARQLPGPGTNNIDDDSSLRVEPFSTNSQVTRHTEVSGFSRAQFYDASTVLDGSLNCSAAGDAWADGAIDLGTPGYTITGCDHAP